MSQELYRIVFKGETSLGFSAEHVRANLKKLCGYKEEVLDKLFSGEGFTLKGDLDAQSVHRYATALKHTGALCYIEPMPKPLPPESKSGKAKDYCCPKCGEKQPEGLSCLYCGVVFEKYLRMLERNRVQQIGQGPPAKVGGQSPSRQPEAGVPPDPGWSERLFAHFARHPEQAFLLKTFLMVLAVILLRETLSGMMGYIFLVFPVVFLMFVRMQAAATGQRPSAVLAQHITLMPVMYAEGERKKEGVTWLTYGLIFSNILIFYGFEIHAGPEILDNLVFLPAKVNLWNVPVSAFTHMFLHADNAHLWGNMVFLWAVGTVVERRIGWKRLVLYYLFSGIASGFLFVGVGRIFQGHTGHLLGASGAISGVMGIFAVRCYFKSMVFPLPILGIFSLILPVSLKVRLNSLVIIGLFFLADLSGGIDQIAGDSRSNIGHWAHIGGMLCGVALAALSRMNNEAVEERHMELGSLAWKGGRVSLEEGEESLRRVLQQNPHHAEAMLLLARIQSKFGATEEGESLYTKVIGLLIGPSPQQAVEAFREFYGVYLRGVEPVVLFRLTNLIYRQGDLEMAARCLQMLTDDPATPADIREKAMLQYAGVLEQMGMADVARGCYEAFVESFPDSAFSAKARARLASASC